MNRIITCLLVGLLSLAWLPAAESRTETRKYTLGPGSVEWVRCEPETSPTGSVGSVCFVPQSGDATVSFSVSEMTPARPVLATARFVNATGETVGVPVVFCGSSGALAIPTYTARAIVVLGTLPDVFQGEMDGCFPGVGVKGVVTADFL